MKIKKALQIIKENCSENNCYPGICPMAKRSKSDGCICMFDIDIVTEWDIDAINKRLKAWKRNQKAFKRGILPSSVRLREAVEESIKSAVKAH